MPKHIIEFNLPEETDELKTIMQATDMSIALEDIWNECFRPAMKHGYSDPSIVNYIDAINQNLAHTKDTDGEPFSAEELIYRIGQIYIRILTERNLSV